MLAQSTFDHPSKVGETTSMRPAIAHIHLQNLLHNYQLLRQRAEHAQIMAVVKADAYGHGLKCISQILQQAGCDYFAVTDAAEGAQLRRYLGEKAHIILLSGLFESIEASVCETHRLTPVVTDEKHIRWLHNQGFTGKVWLKVDTGMQRLGAENPEEIIQSCHQHHIALAGIMSHLACADTPEHPLNSLQADAFYQLHQDIAPHLPASLLNSAGLIALPQHKHDMIRPGIALYGAEPIPHEPMGLKPVMQLSGQVMQIRHVEQGSTLSYGASYTAKKDMTIALISLGYGDGLPRALSNQGYAEFQGQHLPIVGRICMDYCLLDVTNKTVNIDDAVTFWGETLSPNTVANLLDTIPYTLMTGINQRVHRIPIYPKTRADGASG
ncbi:MAG: alanine racemase [Mariprofundaceae bacterium]|nr:alanine racemase [Mariprofundaceae bacterium]